MAWSYQSSLERIKQHVVALQDIEVEKLVREADLEGASLQGCNLRCSRFRNTNLRQANLSGSDFSHADLCGADMSSADLTDVIFDETKYDEQTRFPEGFEVSAGRAITTAESYCSSTVIKPTTIFLTKL